MSYVSKSSSCVRKDCAGNFWLKKDHKYFYQTQKQLFAVERKYSDFVVCAFDGCGATKFFHQQILPEEQHWNSVLPKLTKFWRTCILPEVLGKWYTTKHFMTQVQTDKEPVAGGICYCRKNTDEKDVLCCDPKCPIVSFHLSRVKIESIPKTCYCPHSRHLTEFKKSRKAKIKEPKKKEDPSVPNSAMSYDFICVCRSKSTESEKLLQCHDESCENGRFFHLDCLKYKRMPNNSQTTWICPSCCKKVKVTRPHKDDDDHVTFIQTLYTPTEKYQSVVSLGDNEFGIILSPTGWLDCAIIHEAQVLLANVNKNISRFHAELPCFHFRSFRKCSLQSRSQRSTAQQQVEL